uniref:Gamma-secretase-activating protein C-terminal domain-containing protein n=1 Tax=Rhodnius prolixus TaxID=13249 RepID=T1HBR6_RHOPR
MVLNFVGSNNWKLLGQEKDGSILVGFEDKISDIDPGGRTNIAVYNFRFNSFRILHTTNTKQNIIQVSINSTHTLLVYVVKSSCSESEDLIRHDAYKYSLHLTSVDSSKTICKPIKFESNNQIMAQFLYKIKPSDDLDRYLVFIHQECIELYQLEITTENPNLQELSSVKQDDIIKAFSWAQWDALHQSLFYIHTKGPTLREFEGSGTTSFHKDAPTLSALQFNDNVPHESVLNIPLNLPTAPVLEATCRTYDDIPIPLKVHDCSLDVTVLSDDRGIVCICHHYIYQPVKDPITKEVFNPDTTVHVAYSVTLLHHGTVIHCTVPGVPWSQASQIKPLFVLHEDDYVCVRLPGLLTHFLDTCPNHQPCCHLTLNADQPTSGDLTSLHSTNDSTALIDLLTLTMYKLEVSKGALLETFPCHILGWKINSPFFTISWYILLKNIDEKFLNPSLQDVLHEILVGGAYASVYKSLPGDAIKLIRCLPFTTVKKLCTQEIKSDGRLMTMTQEALWNPSVMLLSPTQRLHQFRTDLWIQLWNLIADASRASPFQHTDVAEKLMVSLICYQVS